MKLDVLGLLGACSYALDCVEAELVHVTSRHAKRVAYMCVCTAETLGVHGNALQDLAACALLHDNALTAIYPGGIPRKRRIAGSAAGDPASGASLLPGRGEYPKSAVQHRRQRSNSIPP